MKNQMSVFKGLLGYTRKDFKRNETKSILKTGGFIQNEILSDQTRVWQWENTERDKLERSRSKSLWMSRSIAMINIMDT